MRSVPPPGDAQLGSVAPATSTDPTAQRVATPWPPALPTNAGAAPIRFSRVRSRRDEGLHLEEDRSPPGQLALVMAALMIGLLLMGTQLWLLTVGLELYLGGQGRQVWLLALVSGSIFAGGLMMLRLLGRRPRLGK